MTAPETGWAIYQQYVGEEVRARWEERRLLLRWHEYVQRTHRDAFTLAYLEQALRLGRWSGRMIEFARHMSDIIDAEAMAS